MSFCSRSSGPVRSLALVPTLAMLSFGCSWTMEPPAPTGGGTFTVVMVPDTQNYVDYTHQRAEGFSIDAADLFMQQMAWIAANGRANGGDVDFVASVGDTWQHPTLWIDEEHAARGVGRVDNPLFGDHFDPSPKVLEVEVKKAIEGYRLVSDAKIPFGVPPGNHDYDAMYSVDSFPPNTTKSREERTFSIEDTGVLHVGGLENFRSAFGSDSEFFAGKPWYVDAYDGGTSSAQTFEAGGYTFLHLALEMQAGDAVLDWAREVIAKHPGKPTILSTHDYLSPAGTRITAGFLDFTLVDSENHNTTQQLYEKLVEPSSQIFLVLCGHYHGQAMRVDQNAAGYDVYQVLADYQDRGQVGIDAGEAGSGLFGGPTGIGDGWLRLLRFDTAADPPTIQMETYSTYYEKYSSELSTYSAWYRAHEQPEMTDEEFLAAEEYELVLRDFRDRFGPPQSVRSR